MCRIFGHFDAQVTQHELRTVAAVQRHGGPDAQTFATGPGWALGNNRLAVMDPSGGSQPYRLGEHVTIVFNGEIYNHAELRTRLAPLGHRFADTCDGSVLPALYAEFGRDFTEHLDGMYSVAVVDLRAEPTLLLAGDESGMKPLYYHWDERTRQLRFASELPALLAFPGVPAAVWEPGLDEYLSTKTPFGEQTMFEGIRVLPPATTLTVSRSQGLRTVRRRPLAGAECPTGPAEAADRVRELLRTETARLVRADVPVSVITSGGLDSSLVSALAARAVPDLHSFNIAYTGEWPHDERHFAREAALRNGTRHHQVEIDPADFPDLLPQVVWHLGQPNADPITLSTYALFGAVREAGFRVALTGDAADELFGGYDRIRTAVEAPEGGDWVSAYVDSLAAVPRALRRNLYAPEYRDLVRARGSAADRIARDLAASRTRRLETITEFETGSRMPAYHLRRVDHLSMAASVEVRLPFCQPSLVRYAKALPDELKVSGGRGKRTLYGAASGLLPDAVLSRPKQPFTLPIAAMLVPGTALYGYARDLLAPARLRRRGMLDPAAVDGLFAEQATRPSERAALALWSLLVHELWLEQFMPALGSAAGPAALAEPERAA
ncbi:asparagine synthase (glutamine-hydrolyzing) [Streptomyces sp. NRRL S-87]|uniref:asparagine synthase (glutamine-hydrolyzing) n=1 Tax=Streptomyces sp. NRRL S-87 TaxID=1463920 RepID=UPI00056B57BD|nr:asparagine synthase (glutamine-hydrolyzing) [Streptomyces sp. NRRL S-87]